jgi:hypothetical protein
MITKDNLLDEYPRIFQSVLPKALQQEELDFIAKNIDLYDDDEDISKYVDTFVAKLNEVLEKQQTKAAPQQKAAKPVQQKSQKSPKPKQEPKPKTQKLPKPKKEPKPRKTKPKIGNEVTEFPIEVTLLKSFCGWDGKVKTKTQVYTFIRRLQKAIAAKRIRKTSEYAKEIEYMQNRLIAFHNDMRSGTKRYEIPAAKLSELKGKCNMRWADHVVVIRQYINILNDTKTGLKEKSQKLLKKIEASEFSDAASANSMQLDLPKFEQISRLYPQLSWALLFQTTKDGNFLGEKNWQHAVDVEIYCDNGKAKALKSRYGGSDTVDAF